MNFLPCVNSVSVIGDAAYNARYVLDVTLGNPSSKTAIVFLLNPSSTAKVRVFCPNQVQNLFNYVDVDMTTNHVLGVMNQHNYQRVYLLNLFPYFDGKPASLDVIFPLAGLASNQSYQTNLRHIKGVLMNNPSSDVYIAWGKDVDIDPKLFAKAKSDVIDELYNANFNSVQIKTGKNSKSFQPVKITRGTVINNAIHGRFI